ncbi:hypothetical protein ACHAPI_008697 [Fusarium lateritium]
MRSFQHLLPLALAGSAIFANAQSTYKCPEDKGTKKYELHCGESVRGAGYKTVPATDIVQCAEICSSDPNCKHVVHHGKRNECDLKGEGELFPYTKYPMSTWYFVEEVTPPPPTTGGPGDGSEKPIGGESDKEKPSPGEDDKDKPATGSDDESDDSGNKASYSCPEDDRSLYTTGDFTYELQCKHGHVKGHWTSEPGTTLKACADRCAAVPECNSCDFHYTDKICYLKKAPSETTPWEAGAAWFPIFCPRERAAKANEKPKVTTKLSCPANDGKIFEGSDGTWFYLQCCTDTDAASVLDLVKASSHQDCLEKCVKSKECKSSTFAAESDGSGPNCKLYGHGKFSTHAQPGAHYAFVTDPPTEDAKVSDAKMCTTECPGAHGQIFASVTGENFQMTCKKRHGTTYLKIDRRASFEACMISCAAMPACHSAEYEARTKKCYYSNNHNAPAIDAPAFVSAHSLGCAGACSSCKKGCESSDSIELSADVASCLADHGKIITAGGEDFRLQCHHCFHGHSQTLIPGVKSLGECAKACADNPNCHEVDWMGPSGCFWSDVKNKDGSSYTLSPNALCDSLVPQSRAHASMAVTPRDDTPKERKW